MKNSFDYIIVGQGIAGTLLAYFIQKRGATVLVVDNYNASSSSNIAAGIIHPITGRRKVKTWMADTLIPFAEKTYASLESEYREPFYHKRNIIELVDTTKDYNDWLMRGADSEMKHYFSNEKIDDLYNEVIISSKKISLTNCGWLDVKKLLSAFRKKLMDDSFLINETFHAEDLITSNDGVIYKNLKAKRIIFCDGWLASQNTYWSWLPLLPAKGEIITIHAPQLKAEHIIIKNIFILPLGGDLYKVGSNYEWKELNDSPTQKIKDELITKLKQVLSVPFELVKHEAAVRPAVQDRRPLLGFYPKHKNVGIFNGLGSKGVLLAPYFANHFVEYLYGEKELNAEIDVERFR